MYKLGKALVKDVTSSCGQQHSPYDYLGIVILGDFTISHLFNCEVVCDTVISSAVCQNLIRAVFIGVCVDDHFGVRSQHRHMRGRIRV